MPRIILTRLPLVEYIFEIRWSHPDGLEGLYNEYELMLGKIHEQMEKSDFPEIQRHPGLSREAFLAFAKTDFVTHRFFKNRPSEGKKLNYPLRQYGVGLATLNVDKEKYSWSSFKEEAVKYFSELKQLHKDFLPKIKSISLRSVDFFECEDLSVSFEKIINASTSHAIISTQGFENAVEIPTFQTLIKIPENDTTVSIRAAAGKVEDEDGLILELNAKRECSNITEEQFIDSLQSMHTLIGNAFFEIVTEAELNARK